MKPPLTLLAALALTAASANAATIISFNDDAPGNTSPNSGTFSPAVTTVTYGSQTLPNLVYNITADLTAEGGSATETIVVTVAFTSTGGSPVFNSFNNVVVNGNPTPGQIDTGETLTATLSITSTTFAGNLALDGFQRVGLGGVAPDDNYTISSEGPLVDKFGNVTANPQNWNQDFGSTFTIAPYEAAAGDAPSAVTLNNYTIQLTATAIPEPSAAALLGLGALALTLRRKRL